MSNSKPEKENVRKYYDQEAKKYVQLYNGEDPRYPANLIRLNIIVKRLAKNNVETVLDIGCGTCVPMIRLLKEGFSCKGFDFSSEMVKEGKEILKKEGFDPNLVSQGDVEEPSTLPKEKFDAIIASGVFPHIMNESKALLNIKEMLADNGSVFIEFRNYLFAAFTLNKYSIDLFLNRLIDLSTLPANVAQEVISFYSEILKADKPEMRQDGKIVYTDIMAKFHNPLTIEDSLFRPNGFVVEKIHFYHFHALPPVFDVKHPELFRELSMKMETPSDWRGHFMASAYVVEAKKI